MNTNQNDAVGRFFLHILGPASESERALIKVGVHGALKQARTPASGGKSKAIFSRDEVRRLPEQVYNVLLQGR